MGDTTNDDGQSNGHPAIHRGQFDPGVDNLAERIIYEVAAVRGVDPADLAPLRTAVDPDALNALFDPTGSGYGLREGELAFAYEGFEVTVTSEGEIRLRPVEDAD